MRNLSDTNSPSPLLLTPGPVQVPAHVMQALARPPIHQRTAAFEALFEELRAGLRYLFQTKHEVLALAGSGTMAMQATMRSLFRPGDKVAVHSAGKFSGRWEAYGKALGLKVVKFGEDWRKAVTAAEAVELSQAHPDLRGWVLTHVETSTGVAIDLEEIAFAIREGKNGQGGEQLICVDGICSVGIQPLYLDDWWLDAVVAASQKGLRNPAGTAFVGLSPRAIQALMPAEGDDYMALATYLEAARARKTFPFTPPVQLLYGILAELEVIQVAGLPARWNAVQDARDVFHAGLKKLGGMEFAAGDASRGAGMAAGVTAFQLEGVEILDLRRRLAEEFGLIVANGQAHLKGEILRVGHFGDVGTEEMRELLKVMAQCLAKMNGK
ncbi:MAG: aminotransferase class V-fold PLP-dependent enzyme [Bacteroidota bacterium]